MSYSIWTRCAGSSEVGRLALEPWRVVEAQHQVSTRKLVASDAEQALLEELIEAAKPPVPPSPRLHYLLFTPFRYPPFRHGSRFATRHEPPLWYGSATQRTAFAEVAYYRFVFLEGTSADLGTVETDLTAFRARVRAARGVDLTAEPFVTQRDVIASPVEYGAAQSLGREMREAGVEAFRYPSARDTGGVNVGAFTPRVFAGSRPRTLQTWHCSARRERVDIVKRSYFERVSFGFPRGAFLAGGRLPAPAV